MDLYWNRAELKKEFAGMRKEQYRLKDVIKKHEGRVARVQQQLDHLEDMLADPLLAHSVVVHFQLRGVAQKCQRKLARFAEQLKQQREQKQHANLLGDWNADLAKEAEVIQQQILDKQELINQLEEQLRVEQRRLTSMNAFIRFFRGRSITKTLDALAEQIEINQQHELVLGEEVDEIRDRKPPDTQGLDVPSKRSINLLILAYAQQLYLSFESGSLAELAKESADKSVGAVNYGEKGECLKILDRLQSSIEIMDSKQDFASILQQRAELIGGNAQYNDSSDVVPLSGSVATLFRISQDGVVKTSDLDILGRNVWGIGQVLSR